MAWKFFTNTGAEKRTFGAQELAYNEIVSSVSGITGTTVGTATTIITSSSVVFDGTTAVWVEFFSPNAGVTTSGFRISFELFQDASDVGQLGVMIPSSTTNVTSPYLRRRLTPSAGAHTFTIKAFSPDGGTNVVGAGAGGAATFVPAYIRITRAA